MKNILNQLVKKTSNIMMDQKGQLLSGFKLALYVLIFIVLILVIVASMGIKYYLGLS